MIEKIRIDFEKLPSDALENLLRCDCLDSNKALLTNEAILEICKILANRRRMECPENVIDVEKRWEEFQKYYLGEDI